MKAVQGSNTGKSFSRLLKATPSEQRVHNAGWGGVEVEPPCDSGCNHGQSAAEKPDRSGQFPNGPLRTSSERYANIAALRRHACATQQRTTGDYELVTTTMGHNNTGHDLAADTAGSACRGRRKRGAATLPRRSQRRVTTSRKQAASTACGERRDFASAKSRRGHRGQGCAAVCGSFSRGVARGRFRPSESVVLRVVGGGNSRFAGRAQNLPCTGAPTRRWGCRQRRGGRI